MVPRMPAFRMLPGVPFFLAPIYSLLPLGSPHFPPLVETIKNSRSLPSTPRKGITPIFLHHFP